MARMSHDRPSVTVVIPAYEQQSYISRCLDSVHEQTYAGSIEIVVVDDGSPDDGAAVAANHPSQPRVIRQKNMGVAGARNRGIRESTGEYVAFLDADDWWTADKLEVQLAALADCAQPAISFTRYRRVRSDRGSPAEPEHPSPRLNPSANRLTYKNFVGTSTVVVDRQCLDKVGGFPETDVLSRGGQDYALWLRVAALFPLIYVPEVLTMYRVHQSNRVGTDPVKHFEAGLNALENFYGWAPRKSRAMSGASFRAVVAMRTFKFVWEALSRSHYPPSTIWRALQAAGHHMFI